MTRTLLELRKSVDQLINYHGADAPVAAWIFTKEDVIDFPDGEYNVSEELANKVINSLDDYDHIYTEIFDCIDGELREVGAM
tara:strand:+ start:412 stop:657 length:246 start_codon:yes stop_codon:yes gene_type:complete